VKFANSPAGLRAKVRRVRHRGVRVWQWRLFTPEVGIPEPDTYDIWNTGELVIAAGQSFWINDAHDRARAAAATVLEQRRAAIVQSGGTAVKCPRCGGPAEYEEEVGSAGGIAFQVTCELCGHHQRDSA
jgi:hypothetical protein